MGGGEEGVGTMSKVGPQLLKRVMWDVMFWMYRTSWIDDEKDVEGACLKRQI